MLGEEKRSPPFEPGSCVDYTCTGSGRGFSDPHPKISTFSLNWNREECIWEINKDIKKCDVLLSRGSDGSEYLFLTKKILNCAWWIGVVSDAYGKLAFKILRKITLNFE